MSARILQFPVPAKAPEPVDTRWHVCCRACRTGDHAAAGCEYKDAKCNCGRCEDRTQETFGQPHPDDRKATEEIRAT